MTRLRIFLSLLFITTLGIYATATYYETTSDKTAVKAETVTVKPAETYTHDPYLASRMDLLKLDYSTLNLIRGNNPLVPQAKASFTGPNKLYIGNIRESIFDRVLMHEYIHYIQVTDTTATSFKPYMNELMASNTEFYDRMASYRDGRTCSGDCISLEYEAQAVACTELPDSQLRADFLAWCTAHLPLRLK